MVNHIHTLQSFKNNIHVPCSYFILVLILSLFLFVVRYLNTNNSFSAPIIFLPQRYIFIRKHCFVGLILFMLLASCLWLPLKPIWTSRFNSTLCERSIVLFKLNVPYDTQNECNRASSLSRKLFFFHGKKSNTGRSRVCVEKIRLNHSSVSI